jgi:prevent-host-death family protein
MTVRVSASELQKNFGRWHDRAQREPVQIVKHGRESAYLLSSATYQELLASYRRAVHVKDLTEAEMSTIMASEIASENRFELDEDDRADR